MLVWFGFVGKAIPNSSVSEARINYIHICSCELILMRVCRYHKMATRCVAFHKRLPLFASCSDDGTIQIFHGMVYNDLLQNPLIVPVKILKGGHDIVTSLGEWNCILIFMQFAEYTSNDRAVVMLGVLHCEFHPSHPWIVSSGADHKINLWTC